MKDPNDSYLKTHDGHKMKTSEAESLFTNSQSYCGIISYIKLSSLKRSNMMGIIT